MRIFLIILGIFGAIGVIIIIAFVALFGTLFNNYGPLTDEASTYANESIRAIATDWDRDALTSRASPELQNVLTEASINQLINFGRNQLGSITSFDDDASCILNRLEYSTDNGEFAVADCTATAEFEKAYGTFKVGALKRNGQWKLTAFYVNGELRENGPLRTADLSSLKHLTSLEVSFANRFIALESPDLQNIDVGISSFGAALFQDLPENLEEAAEQLQ